MAAGDERTPEGSAAAPPTYAAVKHEDHIQEEQEDEDDEGDDSWSSDSDVGDALDWSDLRKAVERAARRRSSRLPVRRFTTPQRTRGSPIASSPARSQKFVSHIRASPLEEWEGRLDFGVSNSVTTAIRD